VCAATINSQGYLESLVQATGLAEKTGRASAKADIFGAAAVGERATCEVVNANGGVLSVAESDQEHGHTIDSAILNEEPAGLVAYNFVARYKLASIECINALGIQRPEVPAGGVAIIADDEFDRDQIHARILSEGSGASNELTCGVISSRSDIFVVCGQRG